MPFSFTAAAAAAATAPAPSAGTAAAPALPFSFGAPLALGPAPVSGFATGFGSAPAATAGAGTGAGAGAGAGAGGIPGFSSAALAAFAKPLAPPPPLGGIFSGGLIPTLVPGGFNLGSGAGLGAGAGKLGGGGGDEDEGEDGDGDGKLMDEPEKVVRNKDDKDVYLLDLPCRLHRLCTVYADGANGAPGAGAATKEWKDLGKGTVRVTQDPETKKKRLLVRNTMGIVTLNAGFFAQQKFDKVAGKKGNSISFSAVVSVREYETVLEKDPQTGREEESQRAVEKTGLHSFMLNLKPEEVAGALAVLSAAVAEVK